MQRIPCLFLISSSQSFFVQFGSLISLSHFLIVEFLNVDLKIFFLLGVIYFGETLLEKLMRNFIVHGFGLDDLLGRLFVAKFADLGNDGDVSGWVHFFVDHLDLVKFPESETPFLLHDFINSPAVILDF